MSIVKISVHQLIDNVLMEGSIDNRFQFSEHTAQEGTRLHQKLQKEFAKESKYQSEVSVKETIERDDFKIKLEGRIDGIISSKNITLDEIKTSEYEFSELPQSQLNQYWYQTMIYGYMYAKRKELAKISLRLSYYQTTENKLTQKVKDFDFAELEEFFNKTIDAFIKELKYKAQHREHRNQTIAELSFPFESYRQGQRDLMKAVYATILNDKRLYTMAPTGIGKTLSTIFPTLKSMLTTDIERLFYFTAKIATRKVAEETTALLCDGGLFMTSVTLSSKDSICFLEERTCNPIECPFAKDYYDKLKTHHFEILASETQFTRPVIEQLAKNYEMCPFELGLDLSNYADLIILDYNYLFDPRSYLRRFFSEINPENFLLIDEAHNLIDRTRNMYTATLSLNQARAILKIISGKKVKRQLVKLVKELENLKRFLIERNQKFYAQAADSSTIQQKIFKLTELLKKEIAMADMDNQQVILNFYFELLSFSRINEYYDLSFKTYLKLTETDFELTICCIEPTSIIDEKMSLTKGAVLFSASFTPLSYYQKSLGGQKSDYYLTVASPFDQNNHLLMINPTISVTYRNRQKSITEIVNQINMLIHGKIGNYLIFFPSFAFMKLFLAEFETDAKIIIQEQNMTADDKREFLSHFNSENTKTMVGFAVLGGSFAEGIDLKGECLIGVAIISVGLPMITDETNEIQKYYQFQQRNGFQYAYQIPAMNKVIQAVGRLIRTEKDYGVTLLIDERFNTREYQRFFPEHWQNAQIVSDDQQLKNLLTNFWENAKQ